MKKVIAILFFLVIFLTPPVCNAQSGIITTIAGINYNGFSGDGGQATSAELYWSYGVTLDTAGNIYVADAYNNRIRKITSSTGIINTVAGGGTGSGYGDGGAATNGSLYRPSAVAFDRSGNMYIADGGDCAVRKVTATTGIIITVAGITGLHNQGYTGDGGQATAALLDGPSGIALDDTGNIYLADLSNNVIRKVTVSTGIITTVAGNGYGYHQPFQPLLGGYTGDGGQATNAELYLPSGIALDDSANIYIADWLNSVIRKVTASTGIITTIAGNNSLGGGYFGDGGQATAAEMSPINLTLDALDNIYIADENNNVIRMIIKTSGIITTIAGNHSFGAGYSGNGGAATAAELNAPEGAAIDNLGSLYISDDLNSVIRKVTSNTTGVNEIKKNERVSIFPNPNAGQFTLSSSKVTGKCNLEIFNYLGEKILSKTLPQSQNSIINLTEQPNGIYLYRVLNENGSLAGEGKLVITH